MKAAYMMPQISIISLEACDIITMSNELPDLDPED